MKSKTQIALAMFVVLCAAIPLQVFAQASPTKTAWPSSKKLVFQEADRWKLMLILQTNADGRPTGGTFAFQGLGCNGKLSLVDADEKPGETTFVQSIDRGSCIPGCNIVMEAGNSSYREECKGSITGRGNFLVSSLPTQASYLNEPTTTSWSDPNTGLTWQKCMVRLATDLATTCQGQPANLNWAEASALASKSRLGGFADWRLPSAKELKSLAQNRRIEWWATVWTADNHGDGKRAMVACRHFGNSGSCGPDNWFKSEQMWVQLVRGGAGEGQTSAAMVDPAVLRELEKSNQARQLSTVLSQGMVANDKFGLTSREPSSVSTSVKASDGSLAEIDWFVEGLQQAERGKAGARSEFMRYVESTMFLSYKNDFTSPFDKQDFDQKLALEKKKFYDAVFAYRSPGLPSSMVSFTPVRLESYDFGSEVLGMQICRSFSVYNQYGEQCGGEAENYFSFGEPIQTSMARIGADGELVLSGQATRVPNAGNSVGRGSSGAPRYAVDRGWPRTIKLQIKKDDARKLFDLAKFNTAGMLQGYQSTHAGKILAAKVMYAAPKLKGFSSSGYGAQVSFETPAVGVCLYDGAATTAVLCAEVK
jgi:hypothetical protein